MNNYKHFFNICFATILYLVVTKYFIIDEKLYFNFFADKLSYERIEKLIKDEEKWSWVGYVSIPIWILIKISFVASCLWLRGFLSEILFSFEKLIEITLIAEYISLAPLLIKLSWFLLIQTDYTLLDLQWFSPLSTLNLFERDSIQSYLTYPLHLLSIWEVGYWLLLAYGVGKLLRRPTADGLRFVALSYGPALVLWVLFVIFLNVNYGQ